MIVWLLFFTTVIAFAIIQYKRKFKTGQLSAFPGPKTKPFLGNLLDLGTKPTDFIQTMNKIVKKHGDLTKIWIGPFDAFIFVTDLDVVRYILTSSTHLNKTKTYNLLQSFLGKGLATSNASTWKVHRKMIEPAFSYKIFDCFVTIFNEKLKILTGILDEKGSDVNTIDAIEYLHLYSFDAICEAAMGLNLNVQTQKSEYPQAVFEVVSIIIERIFTFHKRIDSIFKYTRSYKIFKKNADIANAITKSVIKKARLQTSNNKKYKSFIDIFISAESNDSLTDEEIEDQVNTFLFAGQDTVTASMTFALYEIGRNMDIQNNILDEVRTIVGTDKNVDITIADIQNFTYMDLVMRETLRKYPSVPFIERIVEEDVKIAGNFFPKGTNLNMFIYAIHHDERYYPNPEKFDPERFLEERVPFSYLPFSLGPRNCIGQRYANLLFKITIAKLVLNYEIKVPEDFEMMMGYKTTLLSCNGIPIYLKKR